MHFERHKVDWTPEKIRRLWDYYARHPIEPFFSSYYSQSIADEVQRACGRGPVADIGCGRGDLLVELVRRGIDVIGIDDSPESIATAAERVPGSRVTAGSATSLPLGDNTMAGVLFVEVLEHLSEQDLEKALSEARRVLQPKGTLFVTTPNGEDIEALLIQCPDCGAEFHPMQHVRSWTLATLSDRLQRCGFSVRSVRADRLVPNGAWVGRLLRAVYYRLGRQRPHLVAVAAVNSAERSGRR